MMLPLSLIPMLDELATSENSTTLQDQALLILANHPYILFGALLGSALASFACVVVERGKRDESINGRSHCACGRQLKWYENVPVFGWLAIGGKARCCGAVLSTWYLLTEVAGGALCALGAWYGMTGLAVSTGVLTLVTLVLRAKGRRRLK